MATTKEAGSNGNPAGAAKRTRKSKPMSAEHKAALAEGREHGRVVKEFLAGLESHAPKRGRKVTEQTLKDRLSKIEKEIPTADPFRKLTLVQSKMDIEQALASTEDNTDFEAITKSFVAVCRPYSERRGISYAAWRAVGVPPSILKEAGLKRGASV